MPAWRGTFCSTPQFAGRCGEQRRGNAVTYADANRGGVRAVAEGAAGVPKSTAGCRFSSKNICTFILILQRAKV